jgi:hypothetical protein
MQAYTVELEEEVSQLKEENKRLREQQEALRKAVSAMVNTPLQSLSSLSVFSRCCESANLTFQLILLSAEVHGLATISPKYCCGLFGILCRDDILQFSPIQRCHEFTQADYKFFLGCKLVDLTIIHFYQTYSDSCAFKMVYSHCSFETDECQFNSIY